jgi:signal transduction histidine kinase
MTRTDWYLLGFILTVIVACVNWWLAALVYRRNKRGFTNRTLGLALTFMGFWVASGFVEKISDHPSDTFTTWTFRWAYASGTLSLTFFLLFLISLYLDHSPGKIIFWPLLSLGLIASAFSLSPLVVEFASYNEGAIASRYGNLHPWVSIFVIAISLISIYLILNKWHTSKGMDRARMNVMLYGFGFFLPFLILSIFILPAITKNDIFTNYAFIGASIPFFATSYTIVRLRLLDVRVIIRRSGVILFGALTLSFMMIGVYLLLSRVHASPPVEKGVILIFFLLVAIFAPYMWKRLESISSRFLFSGLYDELQLLESVSSILSAHSDLLTGLSSAFSKIISALGLISLGVIIPSGLSTSSGLAVNCLRDKNGRIKEALDTVIPDMGLLNGVKSTKVLEEIMRWPQNQSDRNLGNMLRSMNLAAAIPLQAASAGNGFLLVGEKVAQKALSSTDISFLEKAAERIALYIDNYSLSTQLKLQLEELEKVYRELQQADRFKSEIIHVTSHEFRTPTTVIYGFAQTLLEGWNDISEEDKLCFLKKILSSCERLIHLIDQFFLISRYQEGKVSVRKVPIQARYILENISSSLSPEEQARVIFEANPEHYIFSDPEYLLIILKNIVDNALRFSPADQPVVIKIWRNSVNDYIQVQDFGEGIPLNDRDKVFEPFVRLESLRHHSKGMGLGLHIVRLLSYKLGVEVEIDSHPGTGTEVTLVLSLM